MLARLEINRTLVDIIERMTIFDSALRNSMPTYFPHEFLSSSDRPEVDILRRFARGAAAMQDNAGIPTTSSYYIKKLLVDQVEPENQVQNYLLGIPTLSSKAAHLSLEAVIALFNNTDKSEDIINDVLNRLSHLSEPGTNTVLFLREAQRRKIPHIKITARVVQYGWGKNAKLFDSTLTEHTSAIGTGLASNKQYTNWFLRMAGLPVPEQIRISNLKDALEKAEKLGYPVVIKPQDLEQGQGVEAGLENADQLKSAFLRARRKQRPLLLEKHVSGTDIRVDVIKGKFYSAVARYPASVMGDGEKTVLELISIVNRDPRRSKKPSALMKPIEINDEAKELLEIQSLEENAVPKKGQFVRLRRTSNVSNGGYISDASQGFHADNIALCEQAAKLLRLDIAGVDLLIGDPKKSWKENGGAICEVNAQPQTGVIFPETIGHIFDAFLMGNGRIPTVLLMTDDPSYSSIVATELSKLPTKHRPIVVDGIGLKHETRQHSLESEVLKVLLNPNAQALVLVDDCENYMHSGLPIDRFEQLWIGKWSGSRSVFENFFKVVRPHIRGDTILLSDVAPGGHDDILDFIAQNGKTSDLISSIMCLTELILEENL
jgi:cyanophycin synthetase